MMAQTLDGALVAQQLKGRVAARVAELAAAGIRPGLAAVIVGDNPASKVYVGSKVRTCGELGLHSERYELPETTTTEELLRLVERLNRSDEIDGILVQLPLPGQIDAQRVLEAVDPAKDVDGFHPVNVGRLVQGRAELVACTPSGVIELLDHYAVPLAGARVVVVGRSDIVGKPLALLLLHRHATVTVCHSRTRDLPAVTREAEILIAAIGRAAMITGEYVGEGAVVVDIGMNKATSPGEVARIFGDAEQELRLGDLERRGYTLVGDVEPRSVARRAAALTPVPGGVGPLTIACLMRNTVRAAEMRRGGEGERGIDISSVTRSSPSRS
ncbi:MAG TPA: bifunctional 5,10-methylenetetrahydrofolate dehydrogenase/5,10-methenyltetrahydrofolate cyclohydrolase [Blastocatellia bacterium]|nr:bifunctional 5,10-methylenetetrahydrofolate dehydrogenase/5,10-methenyltetrahydrofolate cyclohydrolase [Blastocatellia bacterium]